MLDFCSFRHQIEMRHGAGFKKGSTEYENASLVIVQWRIVRSVWFSPCRVWLKGRKQYDQDVPTIILFQMPYSSSLSFWRSQICDEDEAVFVAAPCLREIASENAAPSPHDQTHPDLLLKSNPRAALDNTS